MNSIITTMHLGVTFLFAIATAKAAPDQPQPVRVSGVLSPILQVDAKAETGGRIKKLQTDFNRWVKEGDVVAEIEEPAGQAPSGKTIVRAPHWGIVIGLSVHVGDAVSAPDSKGGATVATIADLSQFLFKVQVGDADIGKLALKQTLPIKVAAYPTMEFPGTILSIAPEVTVVDSVKGHKVQALIENPDFKLKPGMTGEMEIPAGQPILK